MKELAKTYDPKGMEDRIYADWLEKKYRSISTLRWTEAENRLRL